MKKIFAIILISLLYTNVYALPKCPGEKRIISKISSGDILCFKNSGAYGFTMTSNYNSRLKPSEVCIYKNKLTEIRKREEFDDLLNRQIDIFND